MYGALFQQETEQALTMIARQPPPPRPTAGIFDGFWGSVLSAPAAAVLDIADTADRATGSRRQFDLRMQAERGALPRLDRGAEAQRQTLERGMPAAAPFRLRSPLEEAVRESLTPDPITTGAASQAAFSIVNLLTKAGIFGAMGGAGFGAGATGLVEGALESQRLQAQGVDDATAFNAGTVRALAMGAGLAAPVAGSTLLRSLGIVAATGPGTFVAEQAAIRGILERADYGKVAEQYDPTDLTGLIVSTLAPAGFAAVVHGARGMRARAEGRAAPATETAPPITRQGAVVPAEAVDAAHTLNLKQAVEQSAPVRDQAAAREAHLAAVDAVEDAIIRGEAVAPRVEVDPDVAARVQAHAREVVAAEAPPEPVAPPRFPRVDEVGTIVQGIGGRLDTTPIAPDRVLYRETNVEGLNDLLLHDLYADQARLYVSDNPDLALGQGANRGVQIEFRPNSLAGEINVKPIPAASGQEWRTTVVAPRAVQRVTFSGEPRGLRGIARRVLAREFLRENLPDGRVQFTRRAEPAKAGEAPPRQASARADEGQPARPAEAPAARPGEAQGLARDPEAAAARQAVESMPDMEVALDVDGSGQPVRMSAREALDMAERDMLAAQQESAGIEAAVACFLRADG